LAVQKIAREGKEENPWAVLIRRFSRHRLAVISVFVIIIMLLLAILAPVIAPFPRDAIDLGVASRPGPPGTLSSTGQVHWLGVDHIGRDLLTRVLYGARVSLTIAIVVVLVQELFGVVLGAIAGFYGGWLDVMISRVIEFLLSIPTLPILLITSSILIRTDAQLPLPDWITKGVAWMLAAPVTEANKVLVLMAILIVLGWVGSARLMRGMALTLRDREFVEALRAAGAYHPQWPGSHLGECQPGVGRHRHRRVCAEFPGRRRPGSDAVMGQYAGSLPELHVPTSVAASCAGHSALSCDDCL
jgi:peptide/nickel transport system permease protein